MRIYSFKFLKISCLTILVFLSVFCIFSFLLEATPFLFLKYDNDPTDGDMLGVVNRLKNNLPIYGDWKKGNLYSLYPPVFFYFVYYFNFFFINPLIFGRISSLFFIFFTIGIIFLIIFKLKQKENPLFVSVLFSGITLALPFFNMSYLAIRSDSLMLFFYFLGLYFLIFKNHKQYMVAFFCVCCVLSKQQGASLLIGSTIFYFLKDLKSAIKFILYFLIIFFLIIIPLEFNNSWNVVKTLFFYPFFAFSGKFLKLEHSFSLFREVYSNLWFKFFSLSAVVGVFSLWKTKYKPVIVCYLLDFFLVVYTSRNEGGGVSYLWPHIFLTIILGGEAFYYIFPSLSSFFTAINNKRRIIFLKMTYIFLFSFCFFLLVRTFYKRIIPLMVTVKHTFRNIEYLNKSGDNFVETIKKLEYKDAGKWFSERLSAPLASIGVVGNGEACTLEYVIASGKIFNISDFSKILCSGSIKYVQSSDLSSLLQLNKILPTCFSPIFEGEIPDRGNLRKVIIWKIDKSLTL